MNKLLTALLASAAFIAAADPVQEQQDFINTIQLGQHVLERKLVAKHFSAIQRHFPDAVKKFPSMSPAEVEKELEAFENVMLQLSVRCTGQPYSPSLGWLTKKRLNDFENDLLATHADWQNNSKSLARFGLHADGEFEWKRINAIRSAASKLKVLPADPKFDLAFAFYKKIVEEKFRLGAQIILFENELDSLQRTAAFRRSLGAKIPTVDGEQVSRMLNHWRDAFNEKNYIRCAELERKTGELIARIKKQVFAAEEGTPDLRPGSSFFSTGVFGFGGNWQTLLNTNVRYSNLYLSKKDEFKPYEDSKFDWEVFFDAENCSFSRYELAGGSWTYAKRKNIYTDPKTGKEKIIDVYWSSLAPGVLFDAHTETVSVVEGSLGVPVPPDAVAGVFDGKVQLISRGSPIPAKKMTEGWLLLLWRKNSAPKIPVILFFEHAPDKLEWGGNGFRIARTPEIGRYAAATLYGAAACDPKFGTGWKELPADVLEQCRSTARHLAYFPLDIDEFFAFEKDGKLRIWNKIRKAVSLKGKWNDQVSAYVPFPPVYTLTDKIRADQPLSKPLMTTRFGFYRTVSGDTLSYTIPAPEFLERIVLKPTSGEEKYIKQLNDAFLSHKGGNSWDNFIRDFCSGNVLDVAAGFCMFNADVKDMLDQQRLPGQLDLSLSGEMSINGAREVGQRVRLADFLVEPNTGRSAFLAGWRGRNQGGECSGRGDMTLFNQLPLFHAYGQALMFGRWNLVERHWVRLKEIYSAVDLCQPWRAPGMNALSGGLIVYGDMYGDGFRCCTLMYRLARGMGDFELADRARYLAAKQTATTINFISPNVIAYNAHLKNLPEAASPKSAIGQLGVAQYGFRTAPWKPYPKDAWNAPFQTVGCTNDYPFYGILLRYCFGDSKLLLDTFAREIPEWNEHKYLYTKRWERVNNAWNYIKYMAFYSRDRKTVRELYEKTFPTDYSASKPFYQCDAKHWKNVYRRLYQNDWMSRGNALPHIIGQNDPLWIGDFGRARLISGTYDREKRIARIELTSARPDTLTFVSMVKPERILLNGKSAEAKHSGWECAYELPLTAGNSNVEIVLPEFRVEDYPFPKAEPRSSELKLSKAPAPQKNLLENTLPSELKVGICSKVDIADFCNSGFSDSPKNMDRKEYWKFPAKDVVCGVPFFFVDPKENKGKSMILLRGQHKKSYPMVIRGIPVNKVPKRIFFLHGMCYNTNNGKVMTYRLNFADGQTQELDIYAGIDVGEWKVAPGGKKLPKVMKALSGNVYPAVRKGQWGEGAGGYIYIWNNEVMARGVTNQDVDQRSLARLKSIDIISAGQAAPIVLAITVEE